MPIFWIAISLISVLTLWLLWRPLNNRSALEMESVQQRNIAIANERAKEINSSFDTGEMNQTERDQAMQDLEISLADELASSHELKEQFSQAPNISTWTILTLIPLLAFGSYSITNNFQADSKTVSESVSFDEVLHHLEQVVKTNPEDQQGLLLLAQAYASLERYSDAANSYKILIEISEPNADLLVNYVDTSAMANGGHFNEEYAAILDYALSLEPAHLSGLWLSGMVEQQLDRPENALRRWLDARPLVSAEPSLSKDLELLISDISNKLGPRAEVIIAAHEQTNNNAATAGIHVSVSLTPELHALTKSDDTVFIYARAQNGPPMPLAVLRKKISELPIEVTLDDSLSMLPGMKLSGFETVLVGARVSKSGQPIPQPGDFESGRVQVKLSSSKKIELTINTIIQ